MKSVLISATALMLLAAPALAQETPAPPPPAPATQSPAETPPPPPAEIAPAPGAEAPPPPDEMRPGRERDRAERDGRRERHGWRHGGRHGPPPPVAARFRLDVGPDGEMKLDVRCAPNEPMQACADIVNGLLDRLSSQSNGSDSNSDL